MFVIVGDVLDMVAGTNCGVGLGFYVNMLFSYVCNVYGTITMDMNQEPFHRTFAEINLIDAQTNLLQFPSSYQMHIDVAKAKRHLHHSPAYCSGDIECAFIQRYVSSLPVGWLSKLCSVK